MPLGLESPGLRFKIFSACQATDNCKENQLMHLYPLKSQKTLKLDVSAVSWHSGLTHHSTVTLKTKQSQLSSSHETAQGRADENGRWAPVFSRAGLHVCLSKESGSPQITPP